MSIFNRQGFGPYCEKISLILSLALHRRSMI
jgi:hypothetical protein